MNANARSLFKKALAREKRFDFDSAGKIYQEIETHFDESTVFDRARRRLVEMDDLTKEKRLYERIHKNGKRVLSEIGVDIAENQPLMDILIEADAVDFDNNTAQFIPIKAEYIDRCMDQIPGKMWSDPGLNAFGTGATPPFLKRPGDDDLRPAGRKEFEEIVHTAGKNEDVVKIFSLPVATDKSVSDYEAAHLMEKGFVGLKMTATRNMSDGEAAFLKGKDHWIDGTSLMTSL